MDQLIAMLSLAGATAWMTTALVNKTGPWNVFLLFRNWVHRLTQGHSPLECFHCTSFWVALVFASAWYGGTDEIRAFIHLIGIMGIAMAVRGQSGDF